MKTSYDLLSISGLILLMDIYLLDEIIYAKSERGSWLILRLRIDYSGVSRRSLELDCLAGVFFELKNLYKDFLISFFSGCFS